MRHDVAEGASKRLDLAIAEAMPTCTRDQWRLLTWIRDELNIESYSLLQHRFRDEPYQIRKYLNLVFWAHHKFSQLDRFGCGAGSTPKRILDIGCGPGHLGLVARHFGHTVVGIDQPFEEPHLYTELCRFFGIEKVPHQVRAGARLPYLGKFDVITATMVEFDLDPVWQLEHWCYLLDDMRSMLVTGGQIYVTLTSAEERPREVWDHFTSMARWSSGHHAFLI